MEIEFIPTNFVCNLFIDTKSCQFWAPCHHAIVRLQVANGGDDLQVWRIPAHALNKQ